MFCSLAASLWEVLIALVSLNVRLVVCTIINFNHFSFFSLLFATSLPAQLQKRNFKCVYMYVENGTCRKTLWMLLRSNLFNYKIHHLFN